MSGSPCPEQNHILDALPPAERERLFPYLKLVALPLGKALYESGDRLQHIYFPTDSIISLLYVLEDGASAEIAVVGNDGAIGVALLMGGETTTNRAIVQSGGSAYQVDRNAAQAGIRPSWRGAAHFAALHTSPDHTNGANGGVQPTSFGRPATMPVATSLP
jgi:hypothetical protein